MQPTADAASCGGRGPSSNADTRRLLLILAPQLPTRLRVSAEILRKCGRFVHRCPTYAEGWRVVAYFWRTGGSRVQISRRPLNKIVRSSLSVSMGPDAGNTEYRYAHERQQGDHRPSLVDSLDGRLPLHRPA